MSKDSRHPRSWGALCTLTVALTVQSCVAFYLPSGVSSHRRGSLARAPASIRFAAKNIDLVSDFCKGTNAFWKELVIPQVREKVEVQPAFTAGDGIIERLSAAPEIPGLPRPVWLTVLGSVPTALGWYGYYKFSVEEELFQHELATEGKVSGCGGYGTLFPFVFGVLAGGALEATNLPGGGTLLEASGAWILLGQLNLYRRVNELVRRGPPPLQETLAESVPAVAEGPVEPPLWAWWALLPPPLDVVVGLRQVHFLALYWEAERAALAAAQGQPPRPPPDADPFATWFPFIASPRFTLRTFLRTPSLWFAFTKDWPDFDIPLLQED